MFLCGLRLSSIMEMWVTGVKANKKPSVQSWKGRRKFPDNKCDEKCLCEEKGFFQLPHQSWQWPQQFKVVNMYYRQTLQRPPLLVTLAMHTSIAHKIDSWDKREIGDFPPPINGIFLWYFSVKIYLRGMKKINVFKIYYISGTGLSTIYIYSVIYLLSEYIYIDLNPYCVDESMD